MIVSICGSKSLADNIPTKENNSSEVKLEAIDERMNTKEIDSKDLDELKNEERARLLNERLIELRDIDKSKLTAVERKELRSEVREIKKELAELSGGVYLSVGAVIIILLLLILLL